MTLNETILTVMREVRNFFTDTGESGDFSLLGGSIALSGEYKVGQYILLGGSILSDGVYEISDANGGTYTLHGAEVDENWSGAVYGLRIPPDFIRLCGEIQTFIESPSGTPSAYTSESVVGLHSWTKAAGGNGAPAGWREVFASRLDPFRKMFAEVNI